MTKKAKFASMACVCALFCSMIGCAEVKEISDQVESVIDMENVHVLAVKNGYPSAIPYITYAEAFDSFFTSPTWKYFDGVRGEQVVEFTGYCLYQEVQVKARLQFILSADGKTFETGALSLNDVPQTDLIANTLVYEAFKEYAVSHEMELAEAYSVWTNTEDYMEADVTTNAMEDTSLELMGEDIYEEDIYEDEFYEDEFYEDEFYEEDVYEEDVEYILPDSDSCYLSDSDVDWMSAEMLRLARNEIYARNGWIFESEDLRKYFNSQYWYEGLYTADEFDESWLNKYERANVELIKSYE
ncbi:MAG: YARHG domain-containing protein [Lachnospiraceae bacterium]|nr:YARHG domain-containing protein [Lachnospiraceae bacterium]